jgi:hypothetical protein
MTSPRTRSLSLSLKLLSPSLLRRGVIGTLALTGLLPLTGLHPLLGPSLAAAGTLRTGENLKTRGSTQIQVTGLRSCTGTQTVAVSGGESGEQEPSELLARLEFEERLSLSERLSCKKQTELSFVLDVVSLSIAKYSLIAACTGAGAPVTAVLGVGALGVQFADLLVRHLPCEDTETEKKMESQIKTQVCEALLANGLRCDPAKLP